MTNSFKPIARTSPHPHARRFDWTVVLLSGWMVGGIHLDAWAHHRVAEALESFFTPWHGVLYSGFLALAAYLVGTALLNWRRTGTWRGAVPTGYEYSLLGIALFLVGGVGDMIWHLLFGIEVGVEALLSPTHLLLGLGGGLMVAGPLRAAWARGQGAMGWAAVAASAYLLALLSFFTAFVNPLSEATGFFQGARPADPGLTSFTEGMGVTSLLLYAALLTGVVLFAARRWRLRGGQLTLLVGLSSLLTLAVHDLFWLWPVTLLAGLLADGLYAGLKPLPGGFRWPLFAALLPSGFTALYLVALALNGGIWWSVHLWAGAVVMAGLVGWLMGFAYSESDSLEPLEQPLRG